MRTRGLGFSHITASNSAVILGEVLSHCWQVTFLTGKTEGELEDLRP